MLVKKKFMYCEKLKKKKSRQLDNKIKLRTKKTYIKNNIVLNAYISKSN